MIWEVWIGLLILSVGIVVKDWKLYSFLYLLFMLLILIPLESDLISFICYILLAFAVTFSIYYITKSSPNFHQSGYEFLIFLILPITFFISIIFLNANQWNAVFGIISISSFGLLLTNDLAKIMSIIPNIEVAFLYIIPDNIDMAILLIIEILPFIIVAVATYLILNIQRNFGERSVQTINKLRW